MSAPHDNHSDGKYPEDKVSHYPRNKSKKLKKMAEKVSHTRMGKGKLGKDGVDWKAIARDQKAIDKLPNRGRVK